MRFHAKGEYAASYWGGRRYVKNIYATLRSEATYRLRDARRTDAQACAARRRRLFDKSRLHATLRIEVMATSMSARRYYRFAAS